MAENTNTTSQLESLLRGSKYSRLSTLPTPGSTKTFSVRAQSDDNEGVKQTTAVNFMDNGTTAQIQSEFTVNQSKNTLSITGRSKSPGNEYTKYTVRARDYYDILAADTNLKNYKSALVHKYLQNEVNTHYKIKNQTTAGITLVYNPA